MTVRSRLLITTFILLAIAVPTRSSAVATDPTANADAAVMAVDRTPPPLRAIDATLVAPIVEPFDSGGLQPYVGGLLPARLRDIAEFGPMVPDPAPLAVFGAILVLIGVSRRYLSA